MKESRVLVLLLGLLWGGALQAACQEAPYDELDFLIGEWQVYDPADALLGESRILPAAGGCALREHWQGVDGLQGEALFTARESGEGWRMTWADSDGLVLELDGEWTRQGLVFTGSHREPEQGEIFHRIVYEPFPGLGQIHQLWEYSTDGGRNWAVFFDAWYVPAMD